MMSVSQAAKALNITRQCVYTAVKHGRLTPIEGIPVICFKEEDVEYYRRHYKRLKLSELRGLLQYRANEVEP